MLEPRYESAYTLDDLIRYSITRKMHLTIKRVQDRYDDDIEPTGFSAFQNTEEKVFSVDDINCYWLIYSEKPIKVEVT